MPIVMASSASSSGSSDLCASLAQVPPKLTQLEDTVSSKAGASHMPLVFERLSRLLKTVRRAQSDKPPECKGAATTSGSLDDLHARLWRLHASARKKARSSSRPLTILPLGDSITDGGAKQRAYRYHLRAILESAGYHPTFMGSMHGVYDHQQGRNASSGVVVSGSAAADWPAAAQGHEGHWGWTSRQLLRGHERQPQRGSMREWIARYHESAHAPDVVLLHIGTNDLTKLVLKDNGPHERVASVARRAQTIVHKLCTAYPRVRVLVAAPLIPYCRFREDDPTRRAERARLRATTERDYGRRLCAAVTDHGKHGCKLGARAVSCVNMSAAVSCNHLVGDGVHPAASGARRMAQAWARELFAAAADVHSK